MTIQTHHRVLDLVDTNNLQQVVFQTIDYLNNLLCKKWMLRHDISNVFLDCDKQTITTHVKNTACLFYLYSGSQYKTEVTINRFPFILFRLLEI